MRSNVSRIIVAILFSYGCGRTAPFAPAEAPIDQGVDSSVLVDASSPDAPAPRDGATPPDSSVVQDGTLVDAGLPDAAMDAGALPDAGIDASLPPDIGIDAALPQDGGTIDSSIPCAPSCEEVCPRDLWDACSFPVSRKLCLQSCRVFPDEPAMLCLRQLACDAVQSCRAVTACALDPRAPDLVVAYAPVAGGPNEIVHRAEVCNIGNGPASAVDLHLYRNRTVPPTVGDGGNRVLAVGTLKAGECRDLEARETSFPAGTYRAYAQVDALDSVLESNENNNVDGPRTVIVEAPRLPDLIVTRFSSPSIAANGRVTYDLRVCNRGNATAGASILGVYANRATPPIVGAAPTRSVSVDELQAGACADRTVRIRLDDGSYRSWALADATGIVTESGENNNTAGPLTVVVDVRHPDLQISDFSVTPQVTSGGTELSVTVCNRGREDSPATLLALYHDLSAPPSENTPTDALLSIGALARNACTRTSVVRQLPDGSYNAWAYVDPHGAVRETDETNNIAGPEPFDLPAVDPCTTICETLVSPCNAIDADQVEGCALLCSLRSETRIACAEEAARNDSCIGIIVCLFWSTL